MSPARSIACGLLAGLVVACGDTGSTTSASSDDGAPPDAGPPMDAGPPPKRTVIQRNPFGHVSETQNLLWDGDFEWSSPFADQYGWIAGTIPQQLTPVESEIIVGPDCHSGVKCARIAKGKTVIGIAVGSTTEDLQASVFVNFDDADGSITPCAKAKVSLVWVGFHDEPAADLTSAEMPDEEGWCGFSISVPKHEDKPYLRVKNGAQATMVVDDAVVKPASPISTDGGPLPITTVPSAEDLQELADLRTGIIANTRPHDAPPNDAERAFGRWKGKTQGGVAP